MRLYPASHATPGPQWHIDDGHWTIGLIDSSVPPTIDASGFIVVRLTDDVTGEPNHNPVVSMKADSDESLTRTGVSAGCSNGGMIVRIGVYKDGVGALDLNRPEHWAMVAGRYNNFWLTFVHARRPVSPTPTDPPVPEPEDPPVPTDPPTAGECVCSCGAGEGSGPVVTDP